jgi:hypothetical protein
LSSVTACAVMKQFRHLGDLIDSLKTNRDCLDNIKTDSNGKPENSGKRRFFYTGLLIFRRRHRRRPHRLARAELRVNNFAYLLVLVVASFNRVVGVIRSAPVRVGRVRAALPVPVELCISSSTVYFPIYMANGRIRYTYFY